MKIGVFDSGIGGLTVLSEIMKVLPSYDYCYLGDNARAPYGDRSADVIYEFTRQGVEFLFKQNCTLVILACNTASARALRRLQQEWLPAHYPERKILGIIIPIVEALPTIKTKKKKIVGLIGTRATVLSDTYQTECDKRLPDKISLTQEACPLLVPLIEEGLEQSTPGIMLLKKYLRPLKLKQVSVLILACTHYPLLKKKIRSIMGTQCVIIDPGPIVAHSLKNYLARHPEIEATLAKKAEIIFFTSDFSARTKTLIKKFWKHEITLTKATLE